MERLVMIPGMPGQYKMIFKYTKKGEEIKLSKETKEKLEEEFLKLRDEAVKVLNKNDHYKKWNAEHEALTGVRVITDENREEYNKFMANKQRRYLQIINGRHLESGICLESDLEEDCDICGIIKSTGIKINMYFEPVKQQVSWLDWVMNI